MPSIITQKTLLNCSSSQVEFFDVINAKSLAFVFNNIVENTTSGDKGPSKFLINQGFSIIRFTSRSLDWHQNIPKDFLEQLRVDISKRDYNSRMAIGHSMGAFASIAFSRFFAIETAIAYAPQFNLDEFPDYRFDYGLANVTEWIYRIDKTAISDNCVYHLIYDSKDRDRLHAQKIKRLIANKNYHEITIPYATHEITAYLHEIGKLKETTLSIIDCRESQQYELRKNRIFSSRYIKAITQSLTCHQDIAGLQRLRASLSQYLNLKNRPEAMCSIIQDTSMSDEVLRARISENISIIDASIEVYDKMKSLLSLKFDETDYYERYPDVKKAQIRAIYHYATFGQIEGRTFNIRRS